MSGIESFNMNRGSTLNVHHATSSSSVLRIFAKKVMFEADSMIEIDCLPKPGHFLEIISLHDAIDTIKNVKFRHRSSPEFTSDTFTPELRVSEIENFPSFRSFKFFSPFVGTIDPNN